MFAPLAFAVCLSSRLYDDGARLKQPRSRLSASSPSSSDLLVSGNGQYMRGELEAARQCYAECVGLGEYPVACDCAVNLGSVVLDLGDDREAERMYRLALAAAKRGRWDEDEGPSSPPFLHLDAAQNLAGLLQGRATARDSTDRQALLFEAASLYREVVRRDDSRWDAWANLGSALLDSDAPVLDAARCLQRAILKAEALEKDGNNNLEIIRGALATAYYGLGTALANLLERPPDLIREALQDDNLILLRNDDDDDDKTLVVDEDRAVVVESAANAFRTSLTLANAFGDDMAELRAKASHALDALSGNQTTTRASATFVKALFDDFASTFDDQLVDGLDYKVPKLIADKLPTTTTTTKRTKVLDAGCGTGLFGVELRGRQKNRDDDDFVVVGVDLSEKMCDYARRRRTTEDRPVYDAVLVGDLCDDEALWKAATEAADDAAFDVVVAADVFCYLGDLEPVLSRFFAALRDGGHALFTVETGTPNDPWALRRTGRYAHSPKYVASVASDLGFRCDSVDDVVARLEQGQPVDASLFVLSK